MKTVTDKNILQLEMTKEEASSILESIDEMISTDLDDIREGWYAPPTEMIVLVRALAVMIPDKEPKDWKIIGDWI